MKTNNKKTRKEITGAQRLKRMKIVSVLLIHLTAIMTALAVAAFWDTEPQDYGFAALQAAMALIMITMTVIMTYQIAHCRGQYRCKVCGQVHTPDEDALADHLTCGKMYCTHCCKLTAHKKLRAKECAQLRVQ